MNHMKIRLEQVHHRLDVLFHRLHIIAAGINNIKIMNWRIKLLQITMSFVSAHLFLQLFHINGGFLHDLHPAFRKKNTMHIPLQIGQAVSGKEDIDAIPGFRIYQRRRRSGDSNISSAAACGTHHDF